MYFTCIYILQYNFVNPFNGGTIRLTTTKDNILLNFFGQSTKIAILSDIMLSLLGTTVHQDTSFNVMIFVGFYWFFQKLIVYLEMSWFSVLLEFAPYLETLWCSWVNLALPSDVTNAVNFHSWHLYFAKTTTLCNF